MEIYLHQLERQIERKAKLTKQRKLAQEKYNPEIELKLLLLGTKPLEDMSADFLNSFNQAASRTTKAKKVRPQDRDDILSSSVFSLLKQLQNDKRRNWLLTTGTKFLQLVAICVKYAYADYCKQLTTDKSSPAYYNQYQGFYFPQSLSMEVSDDGDECLLDIAKATLYNNVRNPTNGLSEELSSFLPEYEPISDFSTRVNQTEDHLRERAREGTLAADKIDGKWRVKTQQALQDLGVI